MISLLHLSTLCNDYRQFGLVIGSSGNILNLSHNQQPIGDLSKHNVFPIQEITFGTGDEKLTTICPRATVCH